MKKILNIYPADKYGRFELALYSIIWTIAFLTPVFILIYNLLVGCSRETTWEEFKTWELRTIPFFIIFLINNHLLQPYLLQKGHKLIYVLTVIAMMATLWFIIPGPDFKDKEKPDHHHPPMTENVNHAPLDYGPHHGPPPHRFDNPAHKPPIDNNSIRQFKPDKPKDSWHKPKHKKHPIDFMKIIYEIIALCIILANLAAKLYVSSMRKDVILLKIKTENQAGELEQLKYHVKPHFLMNTLNNIQALVGVDDHKAYETIQEMSKLMRYLLYEAGVDYISLQKELNFVGNFINLMKIRYPDTVSISVALPENADDIKVPPMLFLPFIENAFKHGISYLDESWISISISIENQRLSFQCANSIPNRSQQDSTPSQSGGFGVENIKRRLQLIYGDDYSLDINSNTDNIYTVKMEIPLTPQKYDN